MTDMFSILIFIVFCLTSISGHGYLFEPVARSSAWLVDSSFRKCCTWPQHMEMFCGGLGYQWNTNGGKCGICGEPYDKKVKLFEKGGAMYKGTIVKTYTQGEQIDVKVMLTANHKGYFEFRLCNLDASPSADATQECLDRHLLEIAGTDSTKYRDVGKHGSVMITVRVQLPPNVACRHCVFQWKYTAGNSWGRDPVTGQSGPGLGRENETFMGCSDIAIIENGSPTDPPMVIIPTTPTITSTMMSSSSNQWTWSTSSNQWVWSTSTSQSSMASSTTRSTIHWTWPTSTSQSSMTSSTTRSTIHWTWPIFSTQGSVSTTSSSSRPPLGLTTWSSDLFNYEIGDEVMYDGIKYRCIAPHRSFAGAEPGILTWAWWQRVTEEDES